MTFIEIDKIFDPFLLYDIEVLEDERPIKAGKLKMVQLKNNVLKFYLESNKTIKQFEYYYPFDIVITPDYIIFDYNIKKLTRNNLTAETYLNAYDSTKTSPLINKQIKFLKK